MNRRNFLLASTAAGAVTTTQTAEVADIDRLVAEAPAVLANLSQLKAAPPPASTTVVLLGRATPGDGGGGTFYWNAGSTETGNNGTIVTPDAGGTGRWKRVFDGGGVNVKWFGAKGDGATDDTMAFNAAFAAYKDVFVPAGTFVLSSTISIPDNGSLRGISKRQAILHANSITGAVVRFSANPSGTNKEQACSHVRITGTATTGVAVSGASLSYVGHITVTGTFTYGFDFQYTWGSLFEHLSTNECTISGAALRIGRYFNANTVNNFYTGHTEIPIGVLVMAADPCQGNVFNNLTLQGCVIGWQTLGPIQGLTINGLYAETTVRTLKLGDKSTSALASSVIINGGIVLGSGTHSQRSGRSAAILLDYCVGVTISGVDFACVYGTPRDQDAISLNEAYNCVATGCFARDGSLWSSLESYLVREASANPTSDITLIGCGRAASGSSAEAPTIVKRADAYSYKYARTYLDTNGAHAVASTFNVPQAAYPPR